jgi:hypothetical protein
VEAINKPCRSIASTPVTPANPDSPRSAQLFENSVKNESRPKESKPQMRNNVYSATPLANPARMSVESTAYPRAIFPGK